MGGQVCLPMILSLDFRIKNIMSIKNLFEEYAPQIVKMRMSDIKPVLEILHENNLESWSNKDFEAELTRDQSIVLVCHSRKVIGFCVARLINNKKLNSNNDDEFVQALTTTQKTHLRNTIETECEIYNIAVKREYHRHGIGHRLLNHLILLVMKSNAVSIWLEVRETNKNAINFYKRNGFLMIYERKNFYSNPTENAIVMKKNL